MIIDKINDQGMIIIGCGKMGSALLQGWLAAGVSADKVIVIDPNPSDWVRSTGVKIDADLWDRPAVVLLAVKPQMMYEVLGAIIPYDDADTVFLSVAAGTPLATFERYLGDHSRIIRTMPNTPAAIGRGITAIIGNKAALPRDLDAAEELMGAVGQVVRLDHEDQMHAVTAVSGSGPAYVFHLIETLAAAGQAEGLPADLAMKLAKATVGGAGQLAEDADESPAQLRVNVTSPNGTTQAALEQLMHDKAGLFGIRLQYGFPELLRRAVKAAANRSRELSNG